MNSFNIPTNLPQRVQRPPPGGQPGDSPIPSKEEIIKGQQQVNTIIDSLIDLVRKPKGELTKKDVFDSASDMIAKGAFSTPEAKQKLIAQLANLPDDEAEIRKALGAELLQAAVVRNHMMQISGEM